MTLMWLNTLLGIIFWRSITAQDNACSDGDFCTYQCHCNNQCPGQDGLCQSNAKCDLGWFGLRCQYRDLVTVQGATVIIDNQKSTKWLTDRLDSTCNTDPDLTSVTVDWDRQYPSTWLRIVMADPIKIVYSTTQGIEECIKQTWSRLGRGTIDIRCEDKSLTKSLKILGNITSLCSLYISGGPHVAEETNPICTDTATLGERKNSRRGGLQNVLLMSFFLG